MLPLQYLRIDFRFSSADLVNPACVLKSGSTISLDGMRPWMALVPGQVNFIFCGIFVFGNVIVKFITPDGPKVPVILSGPGALNLPTDYWR